MHPQSIVHSMVEFTDGATIAQLSLPDMRLLHRLRPGLARAGCGTPFGRIDWAELGRLDFEPPDLEPSRASASPTRPGGRRDRPGLAQRRQRGGRGRPSSTARIAGLGIPDVLDRGPGPA